MCRITPKIIDPDKKHMQYSLHNITAMKRSDTMGRHASSSIICPLDPSATFTSAVYKEKVNQSTRPDKCMKFRILGNQITPSTQFYSTGIRLSASTSISHLPHGSLSANADSPILKALLTLTSCHPVISP